ncbi:Probable ABC transporter permease protein HI_1471 [Candidatus Ornithobacterium hominis]|uniref:Probable ABC transporter permease protein HI_1471 n=1 Tax=Candidatus Ornithobacterium hominis TaxID=2497989 RepID=A0A383U3U8_9FLAO|nr:iron ABC transporter permease [Candidatus Ornithobacterium hominis]MCT7905015.1 iron ABC transporter permease [Candidatus Ornithobacterium hominis]SZD73812.1 Probable ABC transporter permease protein HI_1471 [Candidatus Ornithobacterium hominis]SZD74148.1 Probable ABC transporter permease protein HI_1471 [Candidatus Ornithobacterium hominis]
MMSLGLKKILLLLSPFILIVFSLQLGNTGFLNFTEFWQHLSHVITGNNLPQNSMQTILWQVRLPRLLLTFMVGASLAVSGGVLQAIFRNPIVDPFSLGISSGAAFGAALSMILGLFSVNFFAFIFGVIAVAITYAVSAFGAKTSVVTIVLTGMIISGVFSAMLTLLQYISDPYKLQAIIQWTMGNLHTASWEKVQTSITPILAGLLGIYIFRWKMNLLALGDEEALAVGVKPNNTKIILIGLSTLITAASVAAVGMISLFGLIVPHITRMIFGPNNTIGVFANISLGGSLLLMIDNFSRIVMPFEIPIGVFTMILGAPLFIYLMRKNAINWN